MGTSLACQRAELIGRPPLSQQRKSGMWQGQHPASLLPPLQHQRNCAWRTPLAFTIKGGQTSSSERAARTAPALGWSCSLRETLPSSLTGHLRGQRGSMEGVALCPQGGHKGLCPAEVGSPRLPPRSPRGVTAGCSAAEAVSAAGRGGHAVQRLGPAGGWMGASTGQGGSQTHLGTVPAFHTKVRAEVQG